MVKSASQDKPTALTVRFNHCDIPLDLESAKKYAQIGLKFEKTADILKDTAKISGTNVNDIVQSVYSGACDELRAKYDGISDEEFEGLLKMKINRQDTVSSEIDEFKQMFPNVDISSLPSTVTDLMKSKKIGVIEAYLRTLFNDGKMQADYIAKQAVLKNNAIGSMKSGNSVSGSNAVNAMLQGLKK